MPIKTSLTATAAALALGLGGAAALPAFAQDTMAPATNPSESMGAPAIESAEWSEEKLDAFAAAAVEVGSIQEEAAAEIEGEQDQAAQAALVEAANARMVEAIEAAGDITVPEYIQIAEAAQTDTALRTQIEERIISAPVQ